MQSSRPVQLALAAALAVLLVLNFLYSQLALTRASLALSSPFEELTLLPAPSLQRLWLNYGTFAADISWIAVVINYGEGRRNWARMSNLEHNARVVQELDPHFYRLYDWFPAVYLRRRWPQRFEDAELTTAFVRQGFEAFPSDHELPFHAAMSYIGVQDPEGEGPRRKHERIVELAELAALRGDPDAEKVLPFYRAKLRKGGAVTKEAEAEFLVKLYARAESDRERRQIQDQLNRLMRDRDVAAALLASVEDFKKRHDREAPYLSAPMYALIHE